jgi:flavin reductase (DIM6/NTAB) family NADH-FMN oxidoreductase RutF
MASFDVSDARALRSIFGSFATGVTIATTIDAEVGPVGVTANSFTSVSMTPPLVSWCLRNDSFSLPAFRRARRFAINILGSSHVDLCRRFATAGSSKWCGLTPKRGIDGCPLLSEAIATVECRLVAEHEAGDHSILVGEVEDAWAAGDALPLVFYRGGFYDLQPRESVSAGWK